MRLALGIVAALALAACQVDVEGAVCREPGATADCPAGQACGNDRRCSERALSCAATRCTPGPVFCAATDGTEVEQCVDTDPVCGARVKAACEGRLGDALAAAAAHAQATGARATVTVHGAAGADIVFGAATDETFPLEIPAGVTLVGASPPAGATIVRREGVAAATVMAVQGSVERIRIEAAGASVGVATSCLDAATRPSLAGVEVIGGGTLTTGIAVAGGDCGAALTGVEVSGAGGSALSVVSNVGVPVTVERSRFRESGTGIRMTGGKLTVGSDDPTSAVEVSGNAGEGIVITGGGTIDVTLAGAAVAANGGTGVVLDVVNAASKLAIRSCAVSSNGTERARSYGSGYPQRTAGGLLIRQSGALASFTFQANRVVGNAGDQLAFETAGAWSISPGSCGAFSNLFACVPSGAYAVAVVPGGGSVDAEFSVWPNPVWEGYASSGVTGLLYCNGQSGAPPLPLSCPAP